MRLLLATAAMAAVASAQQFSSIGENRTLAQIANSPVDERIRSYERLLTSLPDDARVQSALVAAYLQKLRESANPDYLNRASKLADRMLEQDGGSMTALRFENEIGLQRHEFHAVAERALSMSRYAPSDPGVWANLGDASMELGDYQQAEQAYLKMFSLRPNLSSYNRLAYLRFVTGDAPRALDLMRAAIESGDPDAQNVAWCWAELGDIYFKIGKLDEASNAYRQAMKLFPALHRASAGLGKVNAANGHFEEAIADYKRAQSIVPMVEYAAALEDLYTAAGKPAEAKKQRDLIAAIEQLGSASNEKTNRNLALALADHNQDLPAAMTLIQAELAVRNDVYTWDAYAWILFKSGRIEEAKEASAKALIYRTPEPMFYDHARQIALASSNEAAVPH